MHTITAPTAISKAREDWKSFLSTIEPGQIVVNNSPNRFGKTYSTLQYISSLPGRWLYLSDRHSQIAELEHMEKIVHWKGFRISCERKDDPFIASLMANGIGAKIICSSFCDKKSCKYKNQFNIPDDVIVVAPKEYLATSYVNKDWDMVIWDENIEKAKKVELVYPEIPDDVFENYVISSKLYKTVGRIRDGYSEYEFTDLEIWANTAISRFSPLIKEIKEDSDTFSPTAEEKTLISYVNNIPMTLEWIRCVQEYGLMDHYYKPYLHNAFDILQEHHTALVILNTSYNSWIYNQIATKYPYSLAEPIVKGIELNNPDSFLFHYNNLNRSCSKQAITDNGTKFGGNYGAEIQDMVKGTINFAHNRDLKTGIITYKSLVKEIDLLYEDKVDVIGYYGGHQGSNKFDDVDVLINIGTYHLKDKGLYNKHYIINNEYLADDPATWGGKSNKSINGMLVNLTDNEKLNRVKLYKMNEEHGQAIFRSGAHVSPRKLVVNFGFVPAGLEKKLTYKRFHNKHSLIAMLNIIKSKIG